MNIVEMHRIPAPPRGVDLFDCSGGSWGYLRKLGEAFGWNPTGTVPSPLTPPIKIAEEYLYLVKQRAAKQRGELSSALLDLYEPRTWGNMIRMITAEDAANWSAALERALESAEVIDCPHAGAIIISETMTPDQQDLVNGGIDREYVQEFADYIRRGAFGFAWDD